MMTTAEDRHDRPDDLHPERGSLPFLLLVMLLTTALGAVLVTTVSAQVRTSSFNESRTRALDAAQGGVDSALAQIRSAVEAGGTDAGTGATVKGDAGKLPCFGTPTWTKLGGSIWYRVSVTYYTRNPATTKKADLTAMVCSEQAGTFSSTDSSRTPRFAVVRAEGVDRARTGDGASGGRTVEATYVFQTNDVNVVGGQIRLFPPTGVTNPTPYCMDAGSPKPKEGDKVVIQPCSTTNPPLPQQVWAYRGDLSIELVASIPKDATGQATGAAGLCLDTSPTAHASNVSLVLKTCGAADFNPRQPKTVSVCSDGYSPTTYKGPATTCKIGPYNQRFSVDDDAHLRGSNTFSSGGDTPATANTDGFCIDAATQSPGTELKLQSCAGGTTSSRQTWVPDPRAGAAAASAITERLVNYATFTGCFDVTGQNVGSSYMILYSCKQNPDSPKVSWNQKPKQSKTGTAPTQTLIYVSQTVATPYCMKSPNTEGGYVKLQLCPAGLSLGDPSLTWTVYQRYKDDAKTSELAYADLYTIRDSYGRCLSPGGNGDLHDGQYLKLVTTSCDGATRQKWNADPSLLAASVTNLRELGSPSNP